MRCESFEVGHIPILYSFIDFTLLHKRPLYRASMHATDPRNRSTSLAYAAKTSFKPRAILKPTLTSNLCRTLTPTLQQLVHHRNASIIIPTSTDHDQSSPTLTIDATILTTTPITNLPHDNRDATPPLPSFNHRHQRPPPPSGLAGDRGVACTLLDTRGWKF